MFKDFLYFWCKESCKTCTERLLKLAVPLTGKLHTGAMWYLRFKKKMQSSQDRLNLGPRQTKNKPK